MCVQLISLAMLIVGLVVPSAIRAQDSAATAKKLAEEAIASPFDAGKFGAWLGQFPKYGDRYIVEGDALMSELEARNYLLNAGSAGAPAQPGELIVNCQKGVCDRWPKDNRALTYTIDKASFGDRAEEIASKLSSAASEWERVCPECNLTIRAVDEPTTPRRKPMHFLVKSVSNARFIAAAFFPSWPESDMVLLVNDSFFTTSFDRVGVLRHELGHVLGYRHEHIEGVPGCFQEGGEWKRITKYDPKSVMHYLCGGAGSPSLAITDVDAQGHRSHYSH